MKYWIQLLETISNLTQQSCLEVEGRLKPFWGRFNRAVSGINIGTSELAFKKTKIPNQTNRKTNVRKPDEYKQHVGQFESNPSGSIYSHHELKKKKKKSYKSGFCFPKSLLLKNIYQHTTELKSDESEFQRLKEEAVSKSNVLKRLFSTEKQNK